MYQIIQTIKEFVGGWYYYFDQVYDTYDLGIIQCKLGGTMYKGLDDIQDLQVQMLNLFQNLMSVYLKAMKTYKMLSKNIYKKCRY